MSGKGEFLPPTPAQTIAYLEGEIQQMRAERQEREEAARLEGYAEAEEMIAEGLRKLAEAEDFKAGAAYSAWLAEVRRETNATTRELIRRARERHLCREARAACLREAALAVSVGQFRDVPKGE